MSKIILLGRFRMIKTLFSVVLTLQVPIITPKQQMTMELAKTIDQDRRTLQDFSKLQKSTIEPLLGQLQ